MRQQQDTPGPGSGLPVCRKSSGMGKLQGERAGWTLPFGAFYCFMHYFKHIALTNLACLGGSDASAMHPVRYLMQAAAVSKLTPAIVIACF